MRVNRLTEAEHARVTEAVRAAEHGTDGEIVTIVTARSDAYHDVALHYAIGAMLLVIALAALCPTALEAKIAWFSGGWSSEPRPGRSFFALMLLEAIGFLLVRYSFTWRRLSMALTPNATRSRRVRQIGRAAGRGRVGQ